MRSPALRILRGILDFRSSTDSSREVRSKVVKLPEITQALVALAVVTPDNRLLVVETPRQQLELPGLELGEPNAVAAHLIQFMLRLGLDQMAGQTLYLPGLKVRKQQATAITGLVHLIRLEKAQHFEIPNSRYESTSTLAEEETATPSTRAVARWLLQTRA